MIYAQPGDSFESTADWGIAALVGTIGYTIYDNVGGTTTARTTSNIVEVATGIYAATVTAPSTVGQYSIVWDDTSDYAADDLIVTSTATITVLPGAVVGGGGYQMNYGELQAAIKENRFPATSPFAQWLSAAYADVWNAARWTFKSAPLEAWYTSDDGTVSGSGAQSPPMPVAFGQIKSLYDDNGDKLREYSQRDFELAYTPETTGRPDGFCVVGRQIMLGPTPDSAYAFQLSYKRRLATRTASLELQPGFFQLDTDVALWDDHHYILVIRAKIIGLRDRSDPTAGDLEGEYGRLLEAMRGDYVETLPRGSRLPAWRP